MVSKRLLALALFMVFLFPACDARAAAPAAYRDNGMGSEVQSLLRYKLITSIHGACRKNSSGGLDISGTVSSDLSTYAKVTITLQKSGSSGWVDMSGYTWSSTGTTSATKTKSATPSSGLLYRLKIKGYVSNSTTEETETLYTSSVSL